MQTVTVFTPTFNRAEKLKRAYKSLLNQTSMDFIWLIIDDGSSDNTFEVVSEFKKEAPFEIEYHWKSNGGRHTAVNYSYEYLKTLYVITLDSDDTLEFDTIEKVIRTWENIPKDEYNRFWCISGREKDSKNGLMVGKEYPENINKFSGRKQRKKILKCRGEKHCCRKVEILKKYKFPEYDDTKFVTENVVWEQINRKYDQYCVNDIYGTYYTDSEDGLINKGTHKEMRHFTFYYAGIFYVNELFDEIFFNRDVIFNIVNLSRCAMLTNKSYFNVMNSLNAWYKKVLVSLGYPISYIWILVFGKKRE